MSFKSTFLQFMAFSKPAKAAGLPPVKFFREAAHFGEHGRLVVSSIKHGLQAHSVALVFVGKVEAPELDLNTIQYIWDQALEQGYVPHYIEQYGQNNEIRLESIAGAISQVRATITEEAAIAAVTEQRDQTANDVPAVFRSGSRSVPAVS